MPGRADPSWPGARNLRDLGGRELAGGGVTRSGRVLRSGAREYLTDEGWRAARAAGLSTVIDLRNAPFETARSPRYPTVSASAYEDVAIVAAPTEDPDDRAFLEVCGPWLDHPRSWADNARLARGRVLRVLRAIGEAPGPVLIHCTGGRDRTGMISAMLLQLAGATATAIADDYEAGWRGAADHPGHGWVYAPDRGVWSEQHLAVPSPEEIDRQLADRIPWIHRWAGSFDTAGYLTAGGLEAARRRRLSTLLRA
ncbi:tyrosine-protein phosphatase [Kineosporia succinea]|uniref:Tyrosine specific protein phosphatases domain-containing protein n=1 Tax=Kineosporia succinea TaxID=84632 RepID=A0ABT9PA34_9ACTN|nr:tyrosine-protein phosphatase [Kineosporia succinea]MDP9829050.1 hypothetical protein [Kineosporia succinea]